MARYCIILLSYFFILVSCQKEMPDVKSSLPKLTLSKDVLSFSSKATRDTVYVYSDESWSVDGDTPWLIVKKIKKEDNETGSDLLIIQVSSNISEDSRETTIKVIIKGLKKIVRVTQEAEKFPEFKWQIFPAVMIKNTKVEKTTDGYTYTFRGQHNFMNNKIREQVFAGNLISNVMTEPNKIEEFNRYLKDEITILINGSFLDFEAIKMRPSAQRIEEEVDKFIAAHNVDGSGEFYYSNTPQIYSSREELYFLGMGNLGIDLDRLLFGKSYLEEEMQSGERGYIFSYHMQMFSVMPDSPYEFSITEELRKQDFFSRLCYVYWVGYGRTGFLFVETSIPEKEIKIVVQRIAKGEPLTQEQVSVLNKLTFRYLSFDKQSNPSVSKGRVDIVKKYFEGMLKGDVVPLSYSVNSFVPGKHEMIYQVKIPYRVKA